MRALLVAASLVLALSACGGSDEAQSTGSVGQTTTLQPETTDGTPLDTTGFKEAAGNLEETIHTIVDCVIAGDTGCIENNRDDLDQAVDDLRSETQELRSHAQDACARRLDDIQSYLSALSGVKDVIFQAAESGQAQAVQAFQSEAEQLHQDANDVVQRVEDACG